MKHIFALVCLLLLSYIYCDMIIVSLEGTGDFSSIQEAITNSVDGDTILVNPGIYYENINYNGKTISIGSLNMTTGDVQYIHNTIIDGNNVWRVVTIENGEDPETTLMGFTIRNGNAWGGGGIDIEDSSLRLINCIVEDNYTYTNAGGVLVSGDNASIYLSGCLIRNNIAARKCGGLGISRVSSFQFDQINLNSIYGNYSPGYCDLNIPQDSENPFYSTVYLDTFSCMQPDKYFIQNGHHGNNWNWEYLDLHVNTAYYEFYDGDIYVSPDGDDSNSGITPDEPMQTIAGAMTRIISNPEDPNTIYLAEGIYSPGSNNQIFPLNMKAYVNIIGEDMNTVICDGDGNEFIKDYYSGFEYEIRNITFTDTAPPPGNNIYFTGTDFVSGKVYLNNLKVMGFYEGAFMFSGSIEFEMNNITLEGEGGLLAYYSNSGNHSIITNSIVQNASAGVYHSDFSAEQGNIRSRLDVINHLNINNNCPALERSLWSYNTSTSSYTETNLINCTIVDNTSEDIVNPQVSVLARFGGNFNIFNSCIYSNDGYQVGIDTYDGNLGSTVNISHSLIQDTTWVPVLSNGVHSEVNWLGGILDCDPLLDSDYIPIEGSPLIDAGTLSLPYDIELPDTDVYGNPRIYGNGVDIGAVEWQGTGISQEEIVQSPDEITIYPNPFNPATTISFSTPEGTDDTEIIICNVKGQRVKSFKIQNSKLKIHEVVWNGKDDTGNSVSSGVYFVRIKTGEEYVAQSKVTVVK